MEFGIVHVIGGVFGLLIFLTMMEMLVLMIRSEIIYEDPERRMDILDWCNRKLRKVQMQYSGELGYHFYGEFIKGWRQISNRRDELIVIFGPTLSVDSDLHKEFVKDKNGPRDFRDWANCHPVLKYALIEAPMSNDARRVRLFFKSTRKKEEVHYSVSNNWRRTVLIEDPHVPDPAKGGRIIHWDFQLNYKLRRNIKRMIKEKLCVEINKDTADEIFREIKFEPQVDQGCQGRTIC